MGFLYVRQSLIAALEPPIVDHYAADWVAPDRYELRADARRFENWENNYAAKLGLGVAADYALDLGLDPIWARVQALATELRGRVAELPGAVLRDIGREQCGICTFTLEGVDPFAVKAALREENINLSVSQPGSTLLDATRRKLPPVFRASVHYYNDSDEIDRLTSALQRFTG